MRNRPSVTCVDIEEYNGERYCKATKQEGTQTMIRCVNVHPNRCRPKLIDVKTGKKIKRKFFVTKEGSKEKWWEE